MKIRNGFVTNSSSTSFIISTKDELSERTFLKNIGVTGNSAMNKIFEELFSAIDKDKKNILNVIREKEGVENLDSFLKSEGYDQKTIDTVSKLISEGRTVYYGRLRSDGETPSEIYFCCESFILCDDNIYFNGSIGGW